MGIRGRAEVVLFGEGRIKSVLGARLDGPV